MKLMDLVRANKGLMLVMIGVPLVMITIMIVIQTTSRAAQERDDRMQDQAIAQQQEQIETLGADGQEVRDLLKEQNERLKKLGQPTVPVPPPPPTPPPPPVPQRGEQGRGIANTVCSGGRWIVTYDDGTSDDDAGSCAPEPGESGKPGRAPTQAEIAAAVAAFCSDNDECRGPTGEVGPSGKPAPTPKDGEDGQDVTPAQVAAAIAEYCDTNGECRGAQGDQGDRGPGPTDEQIADAVADYCAAVACRGEKGDDGKPGRGILKTVCADGRWVVTYTDDATEDAGACPPGEPGKKGEPGRGIAETECVDGRWQIKYTTGETEDGGRCWPWPFNQPN